MSQSITLQRENRGVRRQDGTLEDTKQEMKKKNLILWQSREI